MSEKFLGQLFDLFLKKLFFEFLGPKSCSQMSGAVVFDCNSCVGMNSFFCGFDVDVGASKDSLGLFCFFRFYHKDCF